MDAAHGADVHAERRCPDQHPRRRVDGRFAARRGRDLRPSRPASCPAISTRARSPRSTAILRPHGRRRSTCRRTVPTRSTFNTGQPVSFDHLDLQVAGRRAPLGAHPSADRGRRQGRGQRGHPRDRRQAGRAGSRRHRHGPDRPARAGHRARASSFVFDGVRQVTTIDWFSNQPVQMPIGIAELGVPALAATGADRHVRHRLPQRPADRRRHARRRRHHRGRWPTRRPPSRCRSRLCGFSADGLFLDQRRPRAARRQGPRHRHRPRRSSSCSRLPAAARPPRSARVDPVARRRSRRPRRRPGTHQLRPQRERRHSRVSRSGWCSDRATTAGWTASADGHDLGPPQLVDGYANGWLIDPTGGDDHGRVAMDPATQCLDRARVVGDRDAAVSRARHPPTARGRARGRRPGTGNRSRGDVLRVRGPRPTDRRAPRCSPAASAGVVAAAVIGLAAGAVTAVAVGVARGDDGARWLARARRARTARAERAVHPRSGRPTRNRPPRSSGPPSSPRVHQFGWLAVAFLVGLVVVDGLWDRVNRTRQLGRPRPLTLTLLLAPTTLLFQPATPSRRRRRGRLAATLESQRLVQPLRQTLLRERAVAGLRALVVHALTRSDGPNRSSSRARWRGPSDGEPGDVEPHLGPGVRPVGVLAARARRSA